MKVHIGLLIFCCIVSLIIGMMIVWRIYNFIDAEESFDNTTSDRQLINQDKRLSNIESE